MDSVGVFVILSIIFVLVYLFKKKSNFSKSGFGQKVTIYYADWCGHCKQALPEFKKARQMSNEIELIESNNFSTSDKEKVDSYPTIIRADGVKYNGQRTAKDIVAFSKA
jgi:thiol-disulfide isomerase/thioredoxin